MALAALIAAAAMAATPHAHAAPKPHPAPASADVPHATGTTPEEDANAEALAAGEAPFPAGAPVTDYGLVTWCYGRALDLAEVAHADDGADRAAIVQKGHDAWKGADALTPKQLAPEWMSWALPPRCGDTARRMLGER